MATGTSYTRNVGGNLTLYVTQEVGGIVSFARTMSIVLEGDLQAPAGGSYNFCEGVSIPPLTVNGVGITWYTDLARTQIVHTGF